MATTTKRTKNPPRTSDDVTLSALLAELRVPDHQRAAMRQALIDTYEVGKVLTDWVLDATFVMLHRDGLIPQPEPGSPMAMLLARTTGRPA